MPGRSLVKPGGAFYETLVTGAEHSTTPISVNASGTRNLIAVLLEPYRERLEALCDQALDVIEDAMKARQFLGVDRGLVDVGPDHFARLEDVEAVHTADAPRERWQAVGQARRAVEGD
ncbi:MAG: hypothetical protein ABI822_18965 [Bryobacteraceae bacterium]